MWPRILNAALGIWLMAAPAVLGYGEPIAGSDRIVGPLAFSFAVMAVWAVLRPLRWLNFALGVWLIAAPWLLGGPTDATINSMATGLIMLSLATVNGQIKPRFGGGWSELWRA